MEEEFTLSWYKERSERLQREFEDLSARFSVENDDDKCETPSFDVEPFILAFGTLSMSEKTGHAIEDDGENDQERARFKKLYQEYLLKTKESERALSLESCQSKEEMVFPETQPSDDREIYKYFYHQWSSDDFVNELYDEFISRTKRRREGIESPMDHKTDANRDAQLSLTEALSDDTKWASYIELRVQKAEAMKKLVEEQSEEPFCSDVNSEETWDSFIRKLRNDNYIVEALTSDESELSEGDEDPEPVYSYSSAIEFKDSLEDVASYLEEINKDADKRRALEASKLPPPPPEVVDFEDKEEAAREDADIEKRRVERNNARARKEKTKKHSRKEEIRKEAPQSKPSNKNSTAIKEPKGKSKDEKKESIAISKVVTQPVKEPAKNVKAKNEKEPPQSTKVRNASSSSDDDLAALEAMADGKLKSKR